MKNAAGMTLIIVCLFALWAYNTGRAGAILDVVKGTPPTTGTTAGGAGVPGNSLTGSGPGGLVKNGVSCAESGGAMVGDCVSAIFDAVTRPGDIFKLFGL